MVKTTSTASDIGLTWVIESNPTSVYCKVTYKKSDGITLSAPYISTTFTPIIKQANLGNISTSTLAPFYGCTTASVNYILTTFTCSGFQCDAVYTVGTYNITWQPPTGWVQTSISPNGNDVSFTPNATSQGILTATINLPCDYKETRTFNINRIAQTPTFTTSSFQLCTSSATASISPTCGATNYTYTIVGSPGITFTSNGQQVLSTTNTTVALSNTGGSSVSTIKARANYVNNVSSVETSSNLIEGLPTIASGITDFNANLLGPVEYDPIQQEENSICLLNNPTRITANMEVKGATNAVWTKVQDIRGRVIGSQSGLYNLALSFRVVNESGRFQLSATNSCGTTTRQYVFTSINCNQRFSLSPNPANSTTSVYANEPL